jgi:hypothetical protein
MRLAPQRSQMNMSKAAKTIVGFAIYMALTGLVLIVSPNTLFAILRLPLTQEPWIRLLGMFMIIVSYYYYRTALSEAQEFFRATVHGRTVIGFFLVYLACTGAGWPLILFACGEWLGAILTWLALRSSPVAGR